MGNPPPPDMKSLGRSLELRRGQLGYRTRGLFIRERGGKISTRTIARLERGERDAYPDVTQAVFEMLYGLVPGSFKTSVQTGQLVPVDRGPDPLNYPPGPLRRIAANPDLEPHEKWALIDRRLTEETQQNGEERRRA